MYVNEARCTGCGACLQVCPSNAIVAALPAIVPAARAPISSVQVTPIVETKTLTAPSRALAPASGAALAFLGREVAPRVASAVVETVLNRAAERTRLQSTPSVRANRPLFLKIELPHCALNVAVNSVRSSKSPTAFTSARWEK